MAFIPYSDAADVPEKFRVSDSDNIIQIHAIHPSVMKLHYDMYIELMHRPSDWSRYQRELVAVVVSDINRCHY